MAIVQQRLVTYKVSLPGPINRPNEQPAGSDALDHPPIGARVSAAAQSSAIYLVLTGIVSAVVVGGSVWLNGAQTGKYAITGPLAPYSAIIIAVVNYLLIWGMHFIQTGDWTPVVPIIPRDATGIPVQAGAGREAQAVGAGLGTIAPRYADHAAPLVVLHLHDQRAPDPVHIDIADGGAKKDSEPPIPPSAPTTARDAQHKGMGLRRESERVVRVATDDGGEQEIAVIPSVPAKPRQPIRAD